MTENDTIVCVSGVGHDEVTIAAKMLDLLNVSWGADVSPPRASSESSGAFWERLPAKKFNDEVIHLLEGTQAYPSHLTSNNRESETLASLSHRVSRYYTENFTGHTLYGVADTNFCHTQPFWHALFPSLHYILVVRNPLDVVSSLQKHTSLSFEAALSYWHTTLNTGLQNTRGQRRLILFFDDIIARPQETFLQLSKFIQVSFEKSDEAVQTVPDAVVARLFERKSSTIEDLLNNERIPFTISALYLALRAVASPFCDRYPSNDALELFSEQSLQTQREIDLILESLVSSQNETSRFQVETVPQKADGPTPKNTTLRREAKDIESFQFNYFLLGLGTVGLLAVNRILADHPDLFVPYWDEAYEILTSENSVDLTKIPQKRVLIGHVWPADPDNWKLIENNTAPDLLLQLVRHPYERALSKYNRAIFYALIHSEPIPDILEYFNRDYEKLLLLQYAQVAPFLKYFGRWELIDFSQLLPDRIDDTCQWMWRLMGVRTSRQSPFRKSKISNQFEIFLYQSAFKQTIRILGREIPISIILSDGLPPFPSMTEEITRFSAAGWDFVANQYEGQKREFIVFTDRKIWHSLAWDIKQYILSAQIVERTCQRDLLPKLTEDYVKAIERYDSLRLDELPSAARRFVKNLVLDDVPRLKGKNDYVDNWQL